MRPEQKRVKQLLTEAISLLCRNSLQFNEEVCVEGLLGITLDKRDIFLVSINETIEQTLRDVRRQPEKQPEKQANQVESNGETSPTARKRRKRKSSREGSTSPSPTFVSHDNESVKKERVDEPECEGEHDGNDDGNGDGRRLNPAHDSAVSTPVFHPSAVSTPTNHQHTVNSATLHSVATTSNSNERVTVKEEPRQEEECFMIDDEDSNAGSDVTSYSTHDMSGWSAGDQSSFNVSDMDMMSAASFQQQFGNLSSLSNNMSGSLPTAANFMNNSGGNVLQQPFAGPGTSTQPSPHGDANQREQPIYSGVAQEQSLDSLCLLGQSVCPLCGRVFAQKHNLKSHIREIHTQARNHVCAVCNKSFKRRTHLSSHMYRFHKMDSADMPAKD